MGLLTTVAGSALGGIAGLFTKKITETAPDGARVTRRKSRSFTKIAAWVLVTALAYHFIVWPILNFHWPHYGFPPLDLGVLSAIGLGVGGW